MKKTVFFCRNLVFIFLFCLGSTLLWTQRASAQTCVPGTFTTIGNASVLPSNELQLTPDEYGQKGGIWSNNKADLSKPFDFTVNAYLGSNDIGGADGLCFVLQDAPGGLTAIGESGRGIGAGDGDGGTGGLNPSFIFEIDTWQNNNMGWNDPAEDHLTAYINGDGRHAGLPNTIMNPVTIANIEDNAYHPFRVTWDPSTQLIKVYLDGVEKASATFDLINYFGGTSVYWGYTAATGASKNRHAVCPQGTLDATIIATNDKYYGVNGVTGGVVGNVLTNDKVNFVQATTSNVILTLKTADPTGQVTLNTSTGAVTVAPGTPAASYTLEYQICQTSAPTNCTYATVFVNTQQPSTISITPLNAWVQQGVNNCWTASVKDASNNPVTNMKVNFAVSGSHSPSPGYAYTDANGNATWCYPGYYPEFPNYTNNITATVDGFPLLSASTGVTWYIWSLASVTLTPETGTSPTRIENCWQALVMDGGYSGSGHTEPAKPLPSQSVKFTVMGPNGSIIPAYTTTSNSAGVAYFCYAGLASGQDHIQATSPANYGTGSNYVQFDWTGTKYPVTYSTNGGNGSPPNDYSSPYDPGVTVTVQNSYGSVWRSGYTLGGWNTQADGLGTNYAEGATFEMPASAVTLYAKWNPIMYQVTYYANGATGGNVPVDPNSPYPNQSTVTVLGNVGTPPLEKTSYWFGGWNTQSDGSGTTYQAGQTFQIVGDVYLYAIWLSSPNPVTYNANGGSGNVPVDPNSPYAFEAIVTVLGNIGTPTPLTRSGYVFNGWNTRANGSGTTYLAGSTFVMPGIPVILYAMWAPAYYVYYYANGGSGNTPYDPNGYPNNSTVTVLGNVGTPAPLTKTGYIFAGWGTGCGTCYPQYQAGQTFQITGTTYLYAKWVSNTPHHVYYNGNGNTGGNVPTDNNTYSYGTTVTVLGNTGAPPLTRTGYVFKGWQMYYSGGYVVQPNTTFTMGESDVTLYANWSPAYPVTYNANGGSGNVPVDPNSPYAVGATVTVLGNIGTPSPLTRTGFTFGGWNTQANGSGTTYLADATFSMPSGAVTLYAIWSENTYTVTYDANGATRGNAPEDPNSPYSYQATVTVLGNVGDPPLEKTDYIFGGWNTAANGSGTTYQAGATFSMPANTVTLYAIWIPDTYPVTYNANGGTGNVPEDVGSPYTPGAIVTVLGNAGEPALTKTGYTFGGWNTLANGSGTTYQTDATFNMPSNAVILYAIWTENTYPVTYDANGGTGNVPLDGSSPYTAGATVTVLGNVGVPDTLTLAGYTFGGWNTQANGSGTTYQAGNTFPMSAGAVTLYAIWNSDINPVTYDANGGSGNVPVDTNSPYLAGATVTVLGNIGTPILTKLYHTFGGWNTQANGSGTTYQAGNSFSMPTHAVTLYAIWIPDTYPVTYDANGGSGNIPVDEGSPYVVGATVTVLGNVGTPSLTKLYHTFGGWNTQANGSGTTYQAGNTFPMTANAVKLYAIWTADTYPVTYDANGGSGNVPVDVNSPYAFGATVTVLGNAGTPPLTKLYHTFGGWNTQANGSGTTYLAGTTFLMPAIAVTLYAIWIPDTYSVTYNANGGTGNVPVDPNSPYAVGVTVTILGNIGTPPLTKTNYTFSGWNTQANGSGTTYHAGNGFPMPANAVTLYAIWTADTYQVTYDPNGGSGNVPVDAGSPYVVGATVTVLANIGTPTLTKLYHTFGGWNTRANGSGTTYHAGTTFPMPANAVILYAIWIPDTYSVTYDANGGTGNAPVDANSPYVFGATVTVLGNIGTPPLTKLYYTFGGWNTQANGSGITYHAGNNFPMPASAVTLYAIWIPDTYPVTYNANGGTGNAPVDANSPYAVGVTVTVLGNIGTPPFRKNNFNFSSWNTQANGSGTTYMAGNTFPMPANGVTLYAIWVSQCQVDAGTDITTSTGQLNATGATLYSWNPTAGLSNPRIANPTFAVAVPTTYTVTGYTELGANLITNGDFSSGNTGFSSAYTNCNSAQCLYPEGMYAIGQNPNYFHNGFTACQDHTSGSGNMMVINGSSVSNTKIWCQNVTVEAGRNYAFSAWVTPVNPVSPPILQFSINDINLGTPDYSPSTSCNWHRFFETWNSGITTSANICVVNQNTAYNGNDFAIDDIVFRELCEATDQVDVYTNPCTNPNDGGAIDANQTICSGNIPETLDNVTSPGGYTGTLEYKWQYSVYPFSSWNDILSNTENYSSRALSETTKFKRLAKVTCENNWLESNVVTVTVDPVSVGGVLSGTSPIIYGSSTGTMNLTSYVGTIQRWEKKFDSGSWTIISNTGNTYSETPNTAGTWHYRAIVKSGVCSEVPSSEFSLTVNPKPLSISADNKVKIYDGLVYSPFTVSYSGFVLGDTYLSLGGTLTFSGSAVSATDVGSYTIIPSGQTSTNYIITYHNGALLINCAPVVTVRNTLNSGYGSLRNGMANVCDYGTVLFTQNLDGQNIVLTTGTLPVDKNVTFDNCTHTAGITISGSGDNFTVNAGKSLTLSGCSKVTVTGNIRNNAGVGGVVLASGSSFIYNSCGLQATAKRLLNNGWHLLGSPFQPNTGATRANLTPAGGSLEMKPYTNGTGWGANITSSLFMLQPLVGYAAKPSLNFTATLTGTLFCSNAISQPACEQTLSLVYNGTGTNQSWNLIANPYTSFLNWNLMGKTNVSTTLYLWDNSLYPTSPPVTTASYFRTYNSASNIGVPSGTKPYIAPMQGFFVKANNANPRLTFPLSARTHSSSAFYKEGSLTEILVRLRAENVMGTDELVVCKNPEAKNDFEEFDSEKMFDGQALEMYSQSAGGEKLVINTINATNTIIPLGLTGNTGAKTRITAYDLESGEQVYLEDRYKGKLISLSENTVYDFEFPTEMITGRFFLRFGNISTPITSDVRVFEDNSQLNIIAQTGEDIQGVEVYTLTGACVYKVKAGNGNMFTGTLDLVPAMYLVRVQTSIATQNVKMIWK